jgi:uncharacterized protein YbjT (DUF2867 family)
MPDASKSAVTGVSGFTGRHIARRLLASGKGVVNLTGHPDRPTDFGEQVTSAPFNFDDPDALRKSLEGVDTLYNTYWIRFAHGDMTFEKAVANSAALISAAKDAGVRRIVHVSITNPAESSPLPYFSGKARVEKLIRESGLSYAVLRPAVIFGNQGILINNIAWFLRRLPVFAVPGDGEYELQPIFVEDLADLAVEHGRGEGNIVLDAVGPEVYSLNDLVRLIGQVVHSRTIVVHVNPQLALIGTGLMGRALKDVVLTRDEVEGLRANLLVSSAPPTGRTRLSDWLRQNAEWIGREYMSELGRHYP